MPKASVRGLGNVKSFIVENVVSQIHHGFAVTLNPRGSACGLEDMQDCSQLSAVGGLECTGEPVVCVVWRFVCIPYCPSSPRHVSAMGVESRPVGVRDNVPFVVMLDVFMLIDWLCDVVGVDRFEAEVLLW